MAAEIVPVEPQVMLFSVVKSATIGWKHKKCTFQLFHAQYWLMRCFTFPKQAIFLDGLRAEVSNKVKKKKNPINELNLAHLKL